MANTRKTTGTSPVHVRRGHVAHSTENSPPIFPKTSKNKYGRLSPRTKKAVLDRTKKTWDLLMHDAAAEEHAAKKALFAGGSGGAGSSAEHASSTPKKKPNNKGQVVAPHSPDCGLSPGNPGRDGLRSSRAILCMTPPSKIKMVD